MPHPDVRLWTATRRVVPAALRCVGQPGDGKSIDVLRAETSRYAIGATAPGWQEPVPGVNFLRDRPGRAATTLNAILSERH